MLPVAIAKYFLHETPLGQLVASACLASFRAMPIEVWPGWVGTIADVKLPRRTVANAAPQPQGGANISIIFQLLRETSGVEGDIAECGVFRGETLVPMAFFASQMGLRKKVFGCDSFEGFDETVQFDMTLGGAEDPDKAVGGFDRTSYDRVDRKLALFGLGTEVTLIKGFFQESLDSIQDRRFSFVHLDCDLYESYKVCLEFFYPRLSKGGVLLLDEYNDPPWPGCNRAVNEFLADKPERCCERESDNQLKYFIRKA